MTEQQQEPGLVKSLLFPAFTDAGANDNFQAQDGGQSESDATTAIHDNRTAASNNAQHEAHYDENQVGRDSPRPLDDSLLTHTGISVEGEHVPDAPQSPPSLLPPPRSILGTTRSASMTTRSGSRPFPTTSPRVVDHSLDHSSVTASSGAVSSVVGVNFLNESKDGDERRENDDDDEPTPVKDNRSSGTMNLQDSSVFQPRLKDLGDTTASSDVFSDVNSTASEMGTVVDAGAAGQRLADVQAMAAFMEKSPLYESESGASDVPFSPPKDVPELSLPTLEERRTDETTKTRDSRSSVFREKMDSVFRERGGASTPPPPPPPEGESPSSATAMVSAAIRRLGSGVGSHLHHHGPYSAPTTPRVVPPSPRVEDYLRSSLSSQKSAEQSSSSSAAYLLRSPGSAVHFQADGSRRQKHAKLLAPRFSRSPHGVSNDSGSSRTLDARGGTSFRHANSLASPLRFARGCLSFDHSSERRQYDNPSTIPENMPTSPPTHYLKRPAQSPVKQSRSWDVTSATSSSQPRTPQSYRSFAFGKSPESSTAGAFRPAPLTRVRHANGFSFHNTATRPAERYGARTLNNISPAVANSRSQDTLALRTPQRIEIERDDALDILACLVERSVAFDQELAQSSQVETIEEVDENDENEQDGEKKSSDTDHKDSSSSTTESEKVELTEDDRVSTFADIGVRDVKSPPTTRRRSSFDLLQADSFSSDLTEAVLMIRRISQEYERKMQDSDNSESNTTSHSTRMKAVDELLRSHTYAAEMRRAAKSASTWLRSIDRIEGSSDGNDLTAVDGAETDSEEPSHATENPDQSEKQSAGEQEESKASKSVDKMDIVALRAMLRSAELKAKEKEDMALRLNEELSKCRAEIGRLQTATRSEKKMFASPNRSILDNDDESMSSADVSTADNVGANELADVLASPISKVGTDKDASIDASFVRSDVVSEKVKEDGESQWHAIAEAKRESVLLKTALSQANETIRKLHESAAQSTPDGTVPAEAPVISMENPELNKLLDDYKDAVHKEHASGAIKTPVLDTAHEDRGEVQILADGNERRTVNVQMLDGENFVTEWDDLTPSLPPPPDHGLRSPIVLDLLQQWTSDTAMHDSLLSWMERIMSGADCETIPPLTISALDHQVRDGFACHVLPLLLRRPDIHVDVQTRAHRRTHYDMSVSVTSSVLQENNANRAANMQTAPSTDNKAKMTQMMAFKASRRNQSVLDESMQADTGAPPSSYNVSDYLRTSRYANSSSEMGSDSVAHSTTTALATNSSKRFAGERPANAAAQRNRVPRENGLGREVDRDMDAIPSHMARAVFGDDVSTSSSTTGGSSQKSVPNSGLMGTLGGAFGGLLRRKPSEPEPFNGESGFHENGFITDEADAVPSFLRHAPPQSPSRSEDDGQPYHRVVSAPPGRIGVTFVDYRGHAMVSDVAPESPLSGWVFPSDILIAIDEVPVSGMRVRDIIKLLTSRKERQRALRVISSHAMNEFTLNTTTPSEAGGLS